MTTHQAVPFAQQLRRYRRDRGLTQKALGERAGMSARGIRALELGERGSPHKDTVRLLAEGLALSSDERVVFDQAAATPSSGPSEESAGPVEDTGAVRTFLIADIRGYTRFTVEWGDEAAARLAARFAELVEEIARAYGGQIVELRGDEALAMFSSCRQALRAAIEMQAAFQEAMERDPSVPLKVGMGLDAGEAIPIKGGYRGGALNLAARLCSIAGAGDVFCSETVIGLARRTDGIALVDRGEVTLKGFAAPIRVIQVAPEGTLPPELPPLQPILVTHPTNLPDEPTPFIGREREIDHIVGLLQDPHIRLVTLTGPGGTGKTRLALQVGNSLLYDYRHGVFFVTLAPLADPVLVPSAIAEVLSVKEETGKDILESLTEHLSDKHLLLVLDNVEHLLGASSVVVSLLDACRELHVLVTSRIPLHLSWENEYAVPSLSVPDPKHLPDLASLSRYESVALFINRARAVKADFQVTNDNAPAVAEICHRLDGLPLAIELAAARIKLFPPHGLLQRLSSRLTLLTGGAKDRPSRQQTLRGAIDWSYSILSPDEQTLFARLSVFAGGCTLEAAEAVCNAGADPRIDVLEGVASLVDKSLLWQRGHDEPRFVMLETLREYAAERLEASGEAERVRHRHATYFIAVAEESEADMPNAVRLQEWLDRLETEHDNLREAIRWLMDTDRAAEALRLTGALYPFWNARGYWREGRRWLEEALSVGAATDAIRAKVLAAVGTIAGARHGDFEYARARLEEALTLWRRVDDPTKTELVLTILALVAYQQEDERWRDFYAEALAHLPDEYGTSWRAVIHFNLGLVAYRTEDLVQARRLFEEALALSRQAGHELYTASSLGWLARLAFDRGELLPARVLVRESLDLARRGQYTLPLMFCLETLAGIAVATGEAERAGRIYGAGAALQQSSGGWLLPQILAKRQPFVDAARAQIGEAAWTAAWEEGRAMSQEEILAHALEESG